jgi:hypothetical protein
LKSDYQLLSKHLMDEFTPHPITYEKTSVQDTAFKNSYPLHFYEFSVCSHAHERKKKTHTYLTERKKGSS